MAFQIMNADTGQFFIAPGTFAPISFETGSEAQSFCKEQGRLDGNKYRVKRVLDDQWKLREQRKFDMGTYQYVPWYNESWWQTFDAMRIWGNHYVHISKKEPGMVAFTESTEKGMENIRTRMKPGRYLEKYYGEILKMYGISVRDVAKRFDALLKPRKLWIATTEDEIEWVYQNGPESCMSSDEYRYSNGWGYPEKGKWPDNYHACRVYAAGDLAVAYIRDDDDCDHDEAEITARALIWPEKKTHSRCYGDEVVLKHLLQKEGYRFAPPLGAKLLRKPFNRQFIVPYIDQGDRTGAGALAIADKKTHLEIVKQGPGTYACNCTSGLSGKRMLDNGDYDDGRGVCGECGDGDEWGAPDAIETTRVHISNSGGDYVHMCGDCRDEYAFQCAYSGQWYDGREIMPVELANGETWSANNFSSYGFTCHFTRDKCSRNERITVRTRDGSKWGCRSRLSEYAFICDYTGDAYANEEKVVMENGGLWSRRAFLHAGFECPSCHVNKRISQQHPETKSCLVCTPFVMKKRAKAEATLTPPPVASDTVVLNDELSELAADINRYTLAGGGTGGGGPATAPSSQPTSFSLSEVDRIFRMLDDETLNRRR